MERALLDLRQQDLKESRFAIPFLVPNFKISPFYSVFSDTEKHDNSFHDFGTLEELLVWGVMQHAKVQENKNWYPDATLYSIFSAQGII